MTMRIFKWMPVQSLTYAERQLLNIRTMLWGKVLSMTGDHDLEETLRKIQPFRCRR